MRFVAACLAAAAAFACAAPVAGQDANLPRPGAAPRGAPVPRIASDPPALQLDFPSVHIGVAEYDEGPTGATVFYFPGGASVAVDVRGGSPGTVGTDFLRLSYDSPFVDAISFAGGSSYGLSAATGAALELRDRRASAEWGNIATVSGAIIFDLGSRRFTTVTPDEALGRAALAAARPNVFPLGARGAGRFAMQGGYFDTRREDAPGFYDRRQHSGQGAAFGQAGEVKVAVFTVVNSLGAVVDREGRIVRCGRDPERDCGTVSEQISRILADRLPLGGASGVSAAPAHRATGAEIAGSPTPNTTLTLVVTNQRLEMWALQRLAVQVHTSMARAIQPFHTENDGDVLFAASTNEVEDTTLTPVDLGLLASELAWDAVLNSVPELPPRATPAGRPAGPDARAAFAGRYEFGPGAALDIRVDGDRLLATAVGPRPVYGFLPGRPEELLWVSDAHFVSRNVREDEVEFVRRGQHWDGLLLNPGRWQLPAHRTAGR